MQEQLDLYQCNAHMPELGWHYGYFAVIGTMATVVISLIVVFRRRGWL